MKRLAYFGMLVGAAAVFTIVFAGALQLFMSVIDFIFGAPCGGVALITLVVAGFTYAFWQAAGEIEKGQQ